MASPPQPIAHGSLDASPFAHVLVSIAERKMTGTLAVWAEPERQGQDRVYFDAGRPIKARLLDAASDLMRGLLPLFRRHTTYAFYPVDLVGESSLAATHIRPFALLAAGLRGGLREDVAEQVFGRFGDTKLRVRRSANLADFEFLPKEQAFLDMLRAEPLSIAEAIAGAGEAKVARRVLYALAITKALTIFSGHFERVSDTELAAHAGAAGSRRPPRRMSQGSMPAARRMSQGTMAAVSASEHPVSRPTVPFGAIPRPADETPRHSSRPSALPPMPDPPAALGESGRERWREITKRAQQVDDQTYFEMLEVGFEASTDTVRDAYFAQVKVWHPDRLSPELAPLRPVAEGIFRQLTTAHDTLSDPEERKQYRDTVSNGGGTPRADRSLQVALEAAMQFQKVQVLLRRREYARAEGLLAELIRAVPNEADHHAAMGMAVWQGRGADAAKEAIEYLQRALELQPIHERALVTKAEILDRGGDPQQALAVYGTIAEHFPNNVAAQRHLRLAKMRGTDTGRHPASRPDSGKIKKPDERGLLSKLFDKKR